MAPRDLSPDLEELATYVLEIRDLDGSKMFSGSADGSRIAFTRDGKEEFISAGDGRATGMKWLSDKKNCLLTRPGEGWCRDDLYCEKLNIDGGFSP
jgi:hypothetical protein